MAIENIKTIYKRRSKIVRNRVFDAFCRLTGDKWQSKTLFLAVFHLGSLIFNRVLDCPLSGVCYSMPKLSYFNNQRFRHLGYKTFFMLNSTEHEIHLAHKCWHLSFISRTISTYMYGSFKARKLFIGILLFMSS